MCPNVTMVMVVVVMVVVVMVMVMVMVMAMVVVGSSQSGEVRHTRISFHVTSNHFRFVTSFLVFRGQALAIEFIEFFLAQATIVVAVPSFQDSLNVGLHVF